MMRPSAYGTPIAGLAQTTLREFTQRLVDEVTDADTGLKLSDERTLTLAKADGSGDAKMLITPKACIEALMMLNARSCLAAAANDHTGATEGSASYTEPAHGADLDAVLTHPKIAPLIARMKRPMARGLAGRLSQEMMRTDDVGRHLRALAMKLGATPHAEALAKLNLAKRALEGDSAVDVLSKGYGAYCELERAVDSGTITWEHVARMSAQDHVLQIAQQKARELGDAPALLLFSQTVLYRSGLEPTPLLEVLRETEADPTKQHGTLAKLERELLVISGKGSTGSDSAGCDLAMSSTDGGALSRQQVLELKRANSEMKQQLAAQAGGTFSSERGNNRRNNRNRGSRQSGIPKRPSYVGHKAKFCPERRAWITEVAMKKIRSLEALEASRATIDDEDADLCWVTVEEEGASDEASCGTAAVERRELNAWMQRTLKGDGSGDTEDELYTEDEPDEGPELCFTTLDLIQTDADDELTCASVLRRRLGPSCAPHETPVAFDTCTTKSLMPEALVKVDDTAPPTPPSSGFGGAARPTSGDGTATLALVGREVGGSEELWNIDLKGFACRAVPGIDVGLVNPAKLGRQLRAAGVECCWGGSSSIDGDGDFKFTLRKAGREFEIQLTNVADIPVAATPSSVGALPRCLTVQLQCPLTASNGEVAAAALASTGHEVAAPALAAVLPKRLHNAFHLKASALRRLVALAKPGELLHGLQITDKIGEDCFACALGNAAASEHGSDQKDRLGDLAKKYPGAGETAWHDQFGPFPPSARGHVKGDVYVFRSGACVVSFCKNLKDVAKGLRSVCVELRKKGRTLKMLFGDCAGLNYGEAMQAEADEQSVELVITRPEEHAEHVEAKIARLKEMCAKRLEAAGFTDHRTASESAALRKLPRMGVRSEAVMGRDLWDDAIMHAVFTNNLLSASGHPGQTRGEYEFGHPRVALRRRDLRSCFEIAVYRETEQARRKTGPSNPRGKFAYHTHPRPDARRPGMARVFVPGLGYKLVAHLKAYMGPFPIGHLRNLRTDAPAAGPAEPVLEKEDDDEPPEEEDEPDGEPPPVPPSPPTPVAHRTRRRLVDEYASSSSAVTVDVDRLDDAGYFAQHVVPALREQAIEALESGEACYAGADEEYEDGERAAATNPEGSGGQKTVFTRGEAMASDDAARWISAELRSWTRVLGYKGIRFRSSKHMTRQQILSALRTGWKHYLKANGEFRARGYICGGSQTLGVDYFATHAPTVGNESVRMLFSIAATDHMPTALGDVSDAFQTTTNDIKGMFARLWPGYAMVDAEGYSIFMELTGGVNGLKQGANLWHADAAGMLVKDDFKRSQADASFFYRRKDNETTLCALATDDFKLASTTMSGLQRFEGMLKSNYACTFEYNAKFYLGGEVERRSPGHIIYRMHRLKRQFIEKLGYDPEKLCPSRTPAKEDLALFPIAEGEDATIALSSRQRVDYERLKSKFASLTGLAGHVAKEVDFAVLRLVRECQTVVHNPPYEAIEALKRLARYWAADLKDTEDGLHFTDSKTYRRDDGSVVPVVAFADASYAFDVGGSVPVEKQTGHSWGGELVTVYGNVVFARSFKIKVVLASTKAAETVVVADTCKPIERIRTMLIEIGRQREEEASWLMTDSRVLMGALVKIGAKYRTRHLRMQFLLLQQDIDEGLIVVRFQRTDLMGADGLTKHLGRIKFLVHRAWLSGRAQIPVA